MPTPQTVPDDRRSWSTSWPEYQPVDITPAELRADGTLAESVRDGWAEPITDPTTIDFGPRQEVALLRFATAHGWPLNPTGRNLGRWGENAAADPIVVADGHILLIRRSDCGQWAIPGGMVDPGETAPAALVRELLEETRVDLSHLTPQILARTYVDDPRNSDHAWVCSTVALYRIRATVRATAADDAIDVGWFPFPSVAGLRDAVEAAGGELYAAHIPLFELAKRADDSRYAQTTEMFAVMHWDKHDSPEVIVPDRALAVRYIKGQWSDEFYSVKPITVVLSLPKPRPLYSLSVTIPSDPDTDPTWRPINLDDAPEEFPGLGNGTQVLLGETKSGVEEFWGGWNVSAVGWDRGEVEAAYAARVAEAVAAKAARVDAFRRFPRGCVVVTDHGETLMRVTYRGSGVLAWKTDSEETRFDSDIDPATLTVVTNGAPKDQ